MERSVRQALLTRFDAEMRIDPPAMSGFRYEWSNGVLRAAGPPFHWIVWWTFDAGQCNATVRAEARAFAAAGINVEWKVYGHDTPPNLVAALVRNDVDPRDRPAGRAGPTVARLARALLLLRADDLLGRLVTHVLATPDRYPLQAVQMPALTKLGRWVAKRPKRLQPALTQWIADARRRLELLTAAVPQPPADLRRDAGVTCKCADCAQLNRFLADPSQRQHDFKMAQPRRDHLENQIQKFRCDVDRRTDRKPRPQVLICTKNTATYHRLLDEYHQNLKHLATLRTVAPKA